MSSLLLFGSLALLFAALSAGSIALALPEYDKRKVDQSLSQLALYEKGLVTQREVAATPFHMRFPVMIQQLSSISRRLSSNKTIDKIAKQLVYAGLPHEVDWFLSAKILAVASTGAVGFTIAYILRPGILWIMIIAAAVIGAFFAPDAWLSWRAGKRQKAIRLSLPGALDMLAVCVEAGLGFDAALAKLISKTSGPLPVEFARMLKEIQMGTNRKDAFKGLSERVTVAELKSFLATMIQADVFGISIADTLKVQAKEMRVRRFQKAEEVAQKAPVKLVFPTILCIFPAIFVVLLGPAAIRIYNNMGQMFGK